jgi:hypothetical protein
MAWAMAMAKEKVEGRNTSVVLDLAPLTLKS